VVHFASFAGKSNDFLLAGDQAGQLKAWSLSTRRPAASWYATASREAVLSVHELSEGRWLSQSKNGTLSVWNAERIISGSEQDANGAAVEASVTVDLHSFCKCEVVDEQTVLVPADGGIACGLWDIRSAHVEAKFSPSGEASQTLASGPRGPTGMCMALGATGACYLLGGYEDGSVQLWDTRNTRPLHASRPHTEPVFGIGGVLFPPRNPSSAVCSAACVSGGADGNLVINTWKKSADKEKVSWDDGTKFPIVCEGSKGISTVHARNDAKIVAAGCWDGKVRLYSLKKPRILASMACHSKGVQCVRFSKDSSLLATCSEDMRIAVWQVYPPE
jgi:WD40 repeat protein